MFDYRLDQLLTKVPGHWLLAIERIFAAATIMLYSGGPFNVILSGGHSQGEMQIAEPDYGFTRNFFLLTYMVSAGLLFGRWKRTVRVIPDRKSVV